MSLNKKYVNLNRVQRKEKEKDEPGAKVPSPSGIGKTVKLNVGGHHFTTSLQTLTRADPHSMLSAMFSGQFDTEPGEDGAFFIDRDGTHFRFILNYLRTGKLLVPEDQLSRREILAEAEFYQIRGILDELTLQRQLRTTKEEGKFHGSDILTKGQSKTLESWLPPEDSALGEVVLLYRA